jgi:acetyl-CoA carboxylase carboxyl transferase subunit alpha
MKQTFLDFEQPIAELQQKMTSCLRPRGPAVDISDEIARSPEKPAARQGDHSKLTAWQIAQVARHPQRPYTLTTSAACSRISATARRPNLL